MRACAATVVSNDVRQALEQQNAAMAAADEAPPMSWAERRKHSATIAEILEVLQPLLACMLPGQGFITLKAVASNEFLSVAGGQRLRQQRRQYI